MKENRLKHLLYLRKQKFYSTKNIGVQNVTDVFAWWFVLYS